MEKARDYARMHGFDYWTTVLSVSPHKNSHLINEIGDDLDLETPKFLHSDFKKDNGYLKSTRMSDEYHMYRQNYCGCVYSYQEMLEEKKQTSNEICFFKLSKNSLIFSVAIFNSSNEYA